MTLDGRATAMAGYYTRSTYRALGCYATALLFCLATALWTCGAEDISEESASREIISNGIGYSKASVGKTGIRFPKLTRYQNQRILQQVNQEIDKLTNTMGCEQGAVESTYEVRSLVTYAEKDIFSIYASASYYCGGSYPTNDNNMSLTFDLKTGEMVSFPSLFRDYKADKKAILRVIFAKQVERAEKLADEPGKDAKLDAGNNSCEDDPDIFSLEHLASSEFAFNFTKGGLQVQPVWPHVIEACAEKVTVPFPALHKFAEPKGILARVIAP